MRLPVAKVQIWWLEFEREEFALLRLLLHGVEPLPAAGLRGVLVDPVAHVHLRLILGGLAEIVQLLARLDEGRVEDGDVFDRVAGIM